MPVFRKKQLHLYDTTNNNTMKKTFISFALALFCSAAGAQHYYQDAVNTEMLRHADYHSGCRREIVLPVVNGYNIYKSDLHTHTVFSDGSVLPGYRVQEAWRDGLDVMAVTEHIEYRPHEATFVNYLENYRSKKHDKAVNQNLTGGQQPSSEGIMVDLNYCVKESQKAAAKYGLTIIPGSEITRSGTYVGHFNALFTTDNNLIYDPDPVKAIRNAKAQGALVMHNHPGWTRKNIDYTETEKVVYGEGLIDGVEVMNGGEFYPGIIDRVLENGQFIAANTDIHSTTATDYILAGVHRPMTLIFAKENTLESLKEALEAGRTLSYGFNTLCGDAQLLKDFFAAGVLLKVVPGQENSDRPALMLTNNTSVSYVIQQDGSNQKRLDPFSTISMKPVKGEKVLKFTVLNMFCSKDAHPVVELPF